jgi:hypothetical protein
MPATHGGLALFVFTERTFVELLVHHGARSTRRHAAIKFLETYPRLFAVFFFHHVVAFMAMIRRRIFLSTPSLTARRTHCWRGKLDG